MNIRISLLFVILVGTIWAEDPQKNLAVLDLNTSDGVTFSDSRMIADRLETEMIQSGKYKVLERRRMSDILNEQGFQQTGACTAANCEVQIGQLLGVDRILAGSLGKVGSLYTLNVKLLNVSTGEILQSQAVDVNGDISKVLTDGCKILAKRLSEQNDSGEATTTIEGGHTAWWIAGGVLLAAAIGGGVYIATQKDDSNTIVDVNRSSK